jgi:hypothetical protein
MNRRESSAFSACLLAPLALLGIGYMILSAYSFFFSHPHQPVWEGESFGNNDQMFPYFFPTLFIYVFVGLVLWLGLILCAVFQADDSVCRIIFGMHLVFNIGATLYWITWVVHFSGHDSAQNPDYVWIEITPLFITIPALVFCGFQLLRRPKSD